MSWVDVIEWVPDSDRRVLAVYQPLVSKRRKVVVARYAGGSWRFVEDATTTKKKSERVTHWMEMPFLPEAA